MKAWLLGRQYRWLVEVLKPSGVGQTGESVFGIQLACLPSHGQTATHTESKIVSYDRELTFTVKSKLTKYLYL